MNHAKEIFTEPKRDGDTDAIVVRIPNTGDASIVVGDRYVHRIDHNLGRIPVGCQIIMSDAPCGVCVISKDESGILIQFDAARVDVHLRIW
jgi:hypothetical protein